ncbi:MAG: cupredoxin domain-containing protein [Actinomycetota bacterium]
MVTLRTLPRVRLLAGLAVAVLLATGCGGARPPPERTRANVGVKMFQFRPGTITVTAGTTVTWINDDQILHTATAGTPEAPAAQIFDGQMPGAGKRFSRTFSKPGRYPYHCARHNGMRGEIEVR